MVADRALSADRELELQVESVYRALGYRVRPQALISGKRVDILATRRVQGLGEVRVHVEVKHTKKQSLPKAEVDEFVVNAQQFHNQGLVNASVIVTNANFSALSYQAAQETYVSLKTLGELKAELLPVDAGLQRIIADYEASPMRAVYVDIGVRDFRSEPSRQQRVSDLVVLARDDPRDAVLLLADYGAGKTTALEHLEFELAQQRITDRDALIPFLVELKRLEDFSEVDAFLVDAFRRSYGESIPRDRLRELISDGQFFLLLDGFDEITLKAGEARRRALFEQLAPTMLSPCPAVVTSRLSYFASHAELFGILKHAKDSSTQPAPRPFSLEQRVRQASRDVADRFAGVDFGASAAPGEPSFRVMELELLDDDGINTYLEGAAPQLEHRGITDPGELRVFLESIYDLNDLMRRPIQLALIVTTIANGLLDPRRQINQLGQAGLYEMYVGLEADRDQEKAASRHEVLRRDDRLRFAEACAERMQRDDRLEIDPENVAAIAQRLFASRSLSDTDVVTDLRTCSFLSIRDDDSMRFVHRSFQEFFLARLIDRHLAEQRPQLRLLRETLSPETLDFLGSYSLVDDERFERLRRCLAATEHDEVLRQNVVSAFVAARETVRDVSLKDTHVQGPHRRYAALDQVTMNHVTFDDARVERVEMRNCTLDGVTWSTTGTGETISIDNSPGALTLYGPCGRLVVNDTEDLTLVLESTSTPAITIFNSEADLNGAAVGAVDIEQATVRLRTYDISQMTATNAVVTVDMSQQTDIDINISNTSLHKAGGDRSTLTGTARGASLTFPPSDVAASRAQPSRLTLSRSFIAAATQAFVDASQWTVDHSVFIGVPPRGLRTEGLSGICIAEIAPPKQPEPANSEGDLKLERNGEMVTITGWGPRYAKTEKAVTDWISQQARSRRHPNVGPLVSKLIEAGCDETELRRVAARVDTMFDDGRPALGNLRKP